MPDYLTLFLAALAVGVGFTLGCRLVDPILARICERLIVGAHHRLQAAKEGRQLRAATREARDR